MSIVVPVNQLGRRMPEAGRIRIGMKGDRGQPQSIQTLRFTSENEQAIREIAALYGGQPKPWNPRASRSEWEVVSQAKSVPIVLPPGCLGSTPVYELWSGGGLVRRCDGEFCTVQRPTPDGHEATEIPCVCAAQESLECKVTTRLAVVLPEIRFAGSWRLETHGWYAAKELPGMVETIQALQSRGFARAVLALERRTEVSNGKTRNFVVPVLRTDHTVNEIVSGVNALGALAAPTNPVDTLALPSPPLLDDQVAEAEIIDDDPAISEPTGSAMWRRIAIKCRELNLDDNDRHAFAYSVSNGRTTSSKELSDDEAARVLRALQRIERGEVEYAGVVNQRAVLTKKEGS